MIIQRLITVLPNALTLIRFALGLTFPWIAESVRLPVVVIAAVTDLLDGAASRQWHVASATGRVLDPLADKVFVLGVVCTLWYEHTLTGWEILLVGLRDWIVIAGLLWLLVRRNLEALKDLPPTLLGKVTTAAQMFFFFMLVWWREPQPLLLWTTAVLSGWAGIDYAFHFLKRFHASL